MGRLWSECHYSNFWLFFSKSILPYLHVQPYFHLVAWKRGIIANLFKVLQEGTKWGKEAHSKVLSFPYLSIVWLRTNSYGSLWDRVWGTLGNVSRRKHSRQNESSYISSIMRGRDLRNSTFAIARSWTSGIADNDALKIRVFISTLKRRPPFLLLIPDVPAGARNSCKYMEERFLNHFFLWRRKFSDNDLFVL